MSRSVSIRISVDLESRVVALAERQGMSRSAACAYLLELALEGDPERAGFEVGKKQAFDLVMKAFNKALKDLQKNG